jgi:fumarate reductase subunit C
MSRPAHPHAMRPKRPARTRTAPPTLPPKFPFSGRYRAYTLFDWTGLIYLLLGFLALRVVWALGSGEAAWNEVIADFENPLYIAFHVLALASVIFVGVRFFGFFPKAQPPRIGSFKPPSKPVILGALYAAWIGITAVFSLILSGASFQ